MEIEVIKATSNRVDRSKGKTIERLRVAAYCRVSTDSEDQLNSYRSQVRYYTDLINQKKEWCMTEVYADEAITGTQITKRDGFQRMISDAVEGKIDMIITKSISRFARNTLDTLKYVRLLKEHNIAVFFEDENINTLTMDGELLLVVLSSVAQQEVENISDNVKKGLKMKMQRGELVGFQGCLGYEYIPETKSLAIIPEEAEIVRYIFERYVQGIGSRLISQELNAKGYKTKYGNEWGQAGVLGIIRNEKYKGDVRLGKTYTVDPISKRRLTNLGEEDQFYIKNHHEAIVSEEVFDTANALLNKRRQVHNPNQSAEVGKREKYSRKYAFSGMIECGFCGTSYTRGNWHSNTKYAKIVWYCIKGYKKGKKYCPHSKMVPEAMIEEAFVESYKLLCGDNKEVLEEFIERVEKTLSESSIEKKILDIDRELTGIESKKKKLLDMQLDDKIEMDAYVSKMEEFRERSEKLLAERDVFEKQRGSENTLKKRIKDFKSLLEKNQVLEKFDRTIFESIVEKIIVGGADDNGEMNPYKITFVYKTGITCETNAKSPYKPRIGKDVAKDVQDVLSYDDTEVRDLYSNDDTDTVRLYGRNSSPLVWQQRNLSNTQETKYKK